MGGYGRYLNSGNGVCLYITFMPHGPILLTGRAVAVAVVLRSSATTACLLREGIIGIVDKTLSDIGGGCTGCAPAIARYRPRSGLPSEPD